LLANDDGAALREVVHPGVNGLLFTQSEKLCAHPEYVFSGFETSSPGTDWLKKGVIAFHRLRWQQAWTREAAPVVIGER
jgi:hypothetical protein